MRVLCPNCNSNLPDDSEFCQYCGVNILAIQAQKTELVTRDCSVPTAQLYKPNPKKKLLIFLVITVSVLLLGSMLLNIYQYNTSDDTLAQIEDLKADISEKDALINAQKETIVSQKSKISELQSASTDGSSIYRAIKAFNYGTKYSDYYSETEVMIVRVGETKSTKVVFSVNAEATVSFQNSNMCSNAEWGETWGNNDAIDFKVTGSTVGTNIYTFTNDYNSHSFNVLVIVMPKG